VWKRLSSYLVIPAKAGLRRQDAEANIREADGPEASRGSGESSSDFGIVEVAQKGTGSRLPPG